MTTDRSSPGDRPQSLDLEVPARVLAIGAHPDDVELCAGATLAKWATAGAHVELLVLTDGSKGTWDPHAAPAQLAITRAHEQRDASTALGAHAVHHLGLVDGELREDPATVERIAAVIRAVRPDVVLGHDPWKRHRLHPDHRHGGFLTVDAVVAARDPHFFPAAGPHHRPRELLLFEADAPDHVELVGDHGEAKVAALLAHRSQWRTTLGIDPDADATELEVQVAAFRTRILDELRATGARVGASAAEEFTRVEGV